MTHIAVNVDWYGPYGSLAEANIAATDFGDGLYMVIGKDSIKAWRPSELKYVGISQKLGKRVNETHETISKIDIIESIWIGEISSHGKAGVQRTQRSDTIDLAEWALAYYLRPELNKGKTKNPPPCEVTLINRWWGTDYKSQVIDSPHEYWPDIIDCREGYVTRLGCVKWQELVI